MNIKYLGQKKEKLITKKLLNKKLNNLFYNLKIKNKDNIFLHSNSIGIQQFCKNKLKKDELYKLFINKILVINNKQITI